jgi:hypothetical protein
MSSGAEPQFLPAVLPKPRLPALLSYDLRIAHMRAGLFSTKADIRVVNHTGMPILCELRGATALGPIFIEPAVVRVEAQTSAQLHVPIGMRVPRVRDFAVCAHAVDGELIVHEHVPAPWALRFLSGAGIIAMLAALLLVAQWFFPPEIAAFEAPLRVLTGDRVEVQYASERARMIRYNVLYGKKHLVSGHLLDSTGSISFVADRPGQYTVWLSAIGANGKTARKRTITAIGIPQPKVEKLASISSLSVDPSVAAPGDLLYVHYGGMAESGDVVLRDDKGVTWDAAPWKESGVTAMRAPQVSKPERFTITLDVARGSTTASARVGFLVAPTAAPVPTSTPLPAAPADVGTSDARITTSPAYVVSGQYFSVDIGSDDVRTQTTKITLQAPDGAPIAEHDPSTGQVLFAAPVVQQTRKYYLVLTLNGKKGAGLLVQPLEVHPN